MIAAVDSLLQVEILTDFWSWTTYVLRGAFRNLSEKTLKFWKELRDRLRSGFDPWFDTMEQLMKRLTYGWIAWVIIPATIHDVYMGIVRVKCGIRLVIQWPLKHWKSFSNRRNLSLSTVTQNSTHNRMKVFTNWNWNTQLRMWSGEIAGGQEWCVQF